MARSQAVSTAQVGAASFFAGKNKIINGDFAINQRAFTSTTGSSVYGFDRFYSIAVDGTTTYSAQTFTLGAAPVAGYEAKNYARVVTTGQTLASAFSGMCQNIEDVRNFAGQTVTISFWAQAGSGTPKIAVEAKQHFGTGGSPSSDVNTYAGQATLSTSWARYSLTVAIPSISGKTIGSDLNSSYLRLGLIVSAGSNLDARTGTLGIQTNTFNIWGVQVEAGSVATAFQTATGTLAGELAACQRYYYLHSSGASQPLNVGYMTSATQVQVNIKFPVTMRSNPSLSATSGTNYYSFNRNGAVDEFNSFTLDLVNTNTAQIYNASEISGTVGQAGTAYIGNASGSVAFSAEL